jgi:hypothetical protein
VKNEYKNIGIYKFLLEIKMFFVNYNNNYTFLIFDKNSSSVMSNAFIICTTI